MACKVFFPSSLQFTAQVAQRSHYREALCALLCSPSYCGKSLILLNLPKAAPWFLLYWEGLAWLWTIQMWAFRDVGSKKELELKISGIQILACKVMCCWSQFLSTSYITFQHLSPCRFRKSLRHGQLTSITLYKLLYGKYCNNDLKNLFLCLHLHMTLFWTSANLMTWISVITILFAFCTL